MNVNLSYRKCVTSVCLACYNGEKYIIEQVTSVLSQLGQFDELIISDNGSSDSTLILLKNITDQRVKILSCMKKGVVKNFENALIYANGDLIVLCDQDDVWLPGRLEAARLALVQHDLSIVGLKYVDELLVPITKCNNVIMPKISLMSTIAFNGYTGCGMAFRREILELILPFPRLVPMHDWWIALVALGVRANISLSDQQLILYRRHDSNVSSTGIKSSANLAKKFYMRIFITLNLADRLLKIFFGNRGFRLKDREVKFTKK